MKQKYPEIEHQFDVWHLSKNIMKKLQKKALSKDETGLMPWENGTFIQQLHQLKHHLLKCSKRLDQLHFMHGRFQ